MLVPIITYKTAQTAANTHAAGTASGRGKTPTDSRNGNPIRAEIPPAHKKAPMQVKNTRRVGTGFVFLIRNPFLPPSIYARTA